MAADERDRLAETILNIWEREWDADLPVSSSDRMADRLIALGWGDTRALRAALERLAPERPLTVDGPNGSNRCRDCWGHVPAAWESWPAEHKAGCRWVAARAALGADR